MAEPPPGVVPRVRPPRRPYLGPPSYPLPPRWGFPALAWRWPTSIAGTPRRAPVTADRVLAMGRQAMVVLWSLAAVAVVAAGGEVWRYVLLLRSRGAALAKSVVDASDALVITGSVLALAFAVVAAVLTVWWLLLARSAAALLGGTEPARPDWQVLVYLAIPGVNLVVAGSVLAELEHAVLRRPVERRPRPSHLVLWWWIVWAVNGLLCAVAVSWRLRDGVQAEADGVLITAAADLVAATTAVLTVLVVRRLGALLAPADPASARLVRVVRVDGAPPPPLRPGRPVGAVR